EKMATNLVSLRGIMGDEPFLSTYRTYGLRWQYKHPTPYDFFNTFNTLSGRDLSWFWRTWWYETWTLDQAVGPVTALNGKLSVTIEDHGLAPMPIRLAITRASGAVERMIIPADVWFASGGTREYTFSLDDLPAITAIEIDPEHVFPDTDRSNNRWSR